MKIPTNLFILITALTAITPSSLAFSPNNNNNHSTATISTAVQKKSSLSSTTTTTPPEETETMFDTFVNESELLNKSTFPIPPDQLMQRAKEILSPAIGLGTKDNGACLADDFEFCAAVVGPINKQEYLGALGNFNLQDSFDITPNFFSMSVDPFQPNRIWFMNRVKGIHTGTFMGAEPTGKEIIYPPQIHHMDFNDNGQLTEYGFYTADRRQGNTGGLGGAFGFMYGVGKPLPIPECQPYKRSWQFRMLSFVGRWAQKLSKKKNKD